ncbi:urea amidolyase [Pseudomonas syringae pv. actinidiae ICMP 18807]|uniref:Urea amidolyase n=2 Tax=Pseudomonas syringae TaxID=317 RepID=S6UIP9_PSESF|nr:urea amidolyase [Pseudomonas syringae pv. actinidiae ICMP 18807]
MRDAQPSGGYPKFATVIEADLWRLGQAPIGSKVRFVQCSYEEAVEALDTNHAFIEDARRLLALRVLQGHR